MGRKFDSLVFSSRKRDQMYNNMTSAGIILVAFANLFRVLDQSRYSCTDGEDKLVTELEHEFHKVATGNKQ